MSNAMIQFTPNARNRKRHRTQTPMERRGPTTIADRTFKYEVCIDLVRLLDRLDAVEESVREIEGRHRYQSIFEMIASVGDLATRRRMA